MVMINLTLLLYYYNVALLNEDRHFQKIIVLRSFGMVWLHHITLHMHILFYLVSYTSYIDIAPNKFTNLQFSNVNWGLARVFFLSYFIAIVYVLCN